MAKDSVNNPFVQLFDKSFPDYVFNLKTSLDSVELYLDIFPVTNTPKASHEEISNALKGVGITLNQTDADRLAEFIAEFNKAPKPSEGYKVMEGVHPTVGAGGFVDWKIDIGLDEKKDSESMDKVDFKEKNLIKNVTKDQDILTVFPPANGDPGVDVFGRTVPGLPGVPAVITAGKNVNISEDGRSFAAAMDGMLIFANHIISVEGVFTVANDVDYSTGNINFMGQVVIGGNVIDGFKVFGDKSVSIEGSVGASNIESNEDIVVKGGVSAKGKGTLKAKGKIDAKYLNQVEVESQSDIVVKTEIINCKVNTMGNIIISRGAIVGGEVIALGDVEVAILGSKMSTKTVCGAGINYSVKTQLKFLNDQVSAMARDLKDVSERVDPYIKDKNKLKHVPPAKMASLRKDLLDFQDKKKVLGEMVLEQKKLQGTQEQYRNKCIKVLKMVNAGVELMIGDCQKAFTDEVKGPVKITPSPEDRSLKIRPW